MVYTYYIHIPLTFTSLAVATILLLGPLTSFMVHQYVLNQKAYADGLTQENLPPATVGNRKASLFVKVNPPILTTDNNRMHTCNLDYLMQTIIRLFNMLLIK